MNAEKPLYNSRIILSYVNLLKKRYPAVDVNVLLSASGIDRSDVSDLGQWFTQSQVDLFHEKVVEALGGMDIAREAGRYAASAESLGLMSKCLLGMMGPANAFAAIRKSSDNLTKSSIYSSRQVAANSVEITVTPVEGVTERPFQCQNRMGFFEALLMMFNFGLPEIEHPECIFKGGDCCRYVVTWRRTWYSRMIAARNYLTPALLVLCVALFPLAGALPTVGLVSMLAALFFASSFASERMQRNELYEAISNLKETSDSLLDQVGRNYNNARMVNEVGQAISRQSDIDEVIENVIKAVENRLLYDRCVILLADAGKSKLEFRSGFGYTEEQLAMLRRTSFNLSNQESQGVFVVCFREQRPILVNDFQELSGAHSPRSVHLSEMMEARSFICCAIVCDGESLGVLAVDNLKTQKRLTQSDMDLLMGIAPAIGISIRNAMYMERERRMAEQMRQSQKMEAVGQLAGGIAHDFNNLLTAIVGFGTLTEMSLQQDHPSKKHVEQVLLAADRASILTQGLLAFSRKQEHDPRPVDLSLIVENIKKLLSRLITAEIDLQIALTDQRLQIVADAAQIEQVVMNLVTNARDAMSGTGTLTITTRQVELTEDAVQAQGHGSAGSFAVLSVTDTGTGMDEATKSRIFEPFFTTKEVGKGTGLGMAIVYGIVNQHEGFLDIESELGVGTTFNVYLPLRATETASPFKKNGPQLSYRGTETVLVAEDATEVRSLTAEVLSRNGYKVIEAVDGEDALEKFTANSGKVDLVIMDVVMPKMNGKDAFREISKISPWTKVLFTSGYTPDDVKKKGLTYSKENFLHKPSSPQALLKKVRDVLAA